MNNDAPAPVSINSLVVTRINPKFSPATVGTESYYITENPENLNEDLFEKLKDIKSQIDNIKKVILNEMNEIYLNEEYQIDESKNCPTDPAKWAASKAKAKAKAKKKPKTRKPKPKKK